MVAKKFTSDLSGLLANLRDRGHGNCPHDDSADGPEEDCRACLSDCAAETIQSIADANAALQGAAHRATSLMKNMRRPLRPSDVMAVQWKNDGSGSLSAIKAIDDNDEIVFAADGTPALEIVSPDRDVERVEVGDYVVRRVVGGLTVMKRDVFEQTQRQIAEMGEPIGRLVYEDGSPLSKPEVEMRTRSASDTVGWLNGDGPLSTTPNDDASRRDVSFTWSPAVTVGLGGEQSHESPSITPEMSARLLDAVRELRRELAVPKTPPLADRILAALHAERWSARAYTDSDLYRDVDVVSWDDVERIVKEMAGQ